MNTHLDEPQFWRWQVAGHRPPIEAALPFALAARAALHAAAKAKGLERLPDAFHGVRDSTTSHTHAFWLPEDVDADGDIDHLLLFCWSGIPAPLVPLLAGLSRLTEAATGDATLLPDCMGRHGPGGLFGPSRSWRGITPYVTPRWLGKSGRPAREKDNPEAQLLRELSARGWAQPLEMSFRATTAGDGRMAIASSFALVRPERRPPGDAVASFVDIRFEQAVWGPIALGYCAHFGLGLMVPVPDDEVAAGS